MTPGEARVLRAPPGARPPVDPRRKPAGAVAAGSADVVASVAAYQRRYRATNKDRIVNVAAYQRRYRAADKDKIVKAREYRRKYWEANKDKIAEFVKEYRRKNRERHREYHRKYGVKYYATPEGKARVKEAQRKYRATPQGKAKRREYQRKYRVTRRGKATRKRYDAAYYKEMMAMKAGARAMSQGDLAKIVTQSCVVEASGLESPPPQAQLPV